MAEENSLRLHDSGRADPATFPGSRCGAVHLRATPRWVLPADHRGGYGPTGRSLPSAYIRVEQKHGQTYFGKQEMWLSP